MNWVEDDGKWLLVTSGGSSHRSTYHLMKGESSDTTFCGTFRPPRRAFGEVHPHNILRREESPHEIVHDEDRSRLCGRCAEKYSEEFEDDEDYVSVEA